MHKNPYTGILGIMGGISRNNNSPDIRIGKILASPPNIKIQYNGIILTKEEIWISQYLLIGYERTAKGHIKSQTQLASGGSGMAEYAPHLHVIDNDYTDNIIYTDTLVKGDYVAIMPMLSEDGTKQQYIILDKIVHL